jgi:hypothetical protein
MKNPLYHRILLLACFFAFIGNILNAQDVKVEKTDTLTSVKVISTEDAKLIIEADTDNTNESDNPQIEFKQDGALVSAKIGFDEDSIGANIFGISTRDNPKALLFTLTGNAGIGQVYTDVALNVKADQNDDSILNLVGADNLQKFVVLQDGNTGIRRAFDTTAFNVRAKLDDVNLLNLEDETGAKKLTVQKDGDFRSNGKIGIGRNPSTFPLEIENSSTGSLIKFYEDGSNTWHLRHQDNGNLGFTESAVADNRMVLAKGGNIGIGIDEPTKTLHIKNNDDPSILLQSNGTNEISGRVAMRQSNLTGVDMYYDGMVDELVFEGFGGGVSEGKHMTIDYDTGNVGIGITENVASGHKLSVNGKIAATEVRIQPQSAWPDYVFADEYELMPLEALKFEIEKNKHLPNIPSADAIHENGIQIGDMQTRMMEKIEELTLYILQLHEEIETLKKKK